MATSKPTSSGDPKLDHELYAKTLQEKHEAVVDGLFAKDQLDLRFGVEAWVTVRRYGLWQSSVGSKQLCPIDDFSFNLHNATVETQERLDDGGLDEVAALVILMKRSFWLGKLEFYDTNWDFHEFDVHYTWHRSWKQQSRQNIGFEGGV